MTIQNRYLSRDRIAIVAALAAPLAAAAILLPFRASWSNTNVALLLVVVIVGVAAIGNRVAGGLAAVWAAVWFDFFFTVPYYRFTIRRSADVTTVILLLLTGIAVSQLAARARRLKVVTITDMDYLAQIHQTASLAKSALAPDVVVDLVRRQLIDLLGLQGARFEYGTLMGRPPRLEPDGTVTVGSSSWDVELSGLPADEIELRTYGNGQYYGRFMLKAKPGSRPPLQARLVAVTLADQAGRAFGTSRIAQSASLPGHRSRSAFMAVLADRLDDGGGSAPPELFCCRLSIRLAPVAHNITRSTPVAKTAPARIAPLPANQATSHKVSVTRVAAVITPTAVLAPLFNGGQPWARTGLGGGWASSSPAGMSAVTTASSP
jgi:hypothetical protein